MVMMTADMNKTKVWSVQLGKTLDFGLSFRPPPTEDIGLSVAVGADIVCLELLNLSIKPKLWTQPLNPSFGLQHLVLLEI